MNYFKKPFVILISSFSVFSCSQQIDVEQDYGELYIKDIDVWNLNDPDFLEITFTKPEFKSEISYSFKSNLISIQNDCVKQEAKSIREIEVTAKTKYHETKFKVKTHYEPSHITDVERIVNDSIERGFTKKNQILFCGDSFFDINLWNSFYYDVSSEYDLFLGGSGGSKLEEWRGLAQKLIYSYSPKYIILNAHSNDFWDGGAPVSDVVSNFELLVTDIHKHLPESKIYYFTMLNRSTKMLAKDEKETSDIVKDFNTKISESAKKYERVTICDIYPHFTNEDGSAKIELFKDQWCHPSNSQYKFYIELLKEENVPISWTK